ncbi:hypothetical protein Daesc_010352 [Daldinia eschscholtzii]|uniref:Uncharacterized protein n=1 Tax=Daldinia eschscholtzii TaxID=292717 RepID=A0AAX6M8R3_9PEZI
MEGAQSSGPVSNSTPTNRSHRPRGGRTSGNRGGRGSRGGRGNRGHRGQQAVERNEVSSANPETSTASPVTAPPNASSRGSGGRRASRGQRRGRGEHAQRGTMTRPRNFGGHLTTTAEESGSTSSTSLNADVADFIPGQPLADRTNSTAIKPQAKNSGKRKASKSNAADLTTRISEDIDNGQYECVPIVVAKHAQNPERLVLTHVPSNVIPALVHLVSLWGRLSPVFVVNSHLQSAVVRRIMLMDGVVTESAEIYFPVESTNAKGSAILASVALAIFLSCLSVIVVERLGISLVTNVVTNENLIIAAKSKSKKTS